MGHGRQGGALACTTPNRLGDRSRARRAHSYDRDRGCGTCSQLRTLIGNRHPAAKKQWKCSKVDGDKENWKQKTNKCKLLQLHKCKNPFRGTHFWTSWKL
eukprot:4839863-Pleurochrysis_carterae.AAC.2